MSSKSKWRGLSVFVPNREEIRNLTPFPLKAQVVDMSGNKGMEHSLRFQSRAPGEWALAQCYISYSEKPQDEMLCIMKY